jgi:hypothetical protein
MKEFEKARKFQEEREEEERIRRERELIQMEFQMEQNKRKNAKDMVDLENKRIMDQHLVLKKGPQNNNGNIGNNVSFHGLIDNNNQQPLELNKETINKLFQNEEDVNLRISLNNELTKLRSSLVDQQNQLVNQINDLKAETQNANLQRYEALKEISQLKEELAKQRADEELRKKYVYDVLVDNNTNVNQIYTHTRLPNVNENELRMELPRNHAKNVKSLYYDDSIKHPNRVPKVPNLDELRENEFKVDSKFIDIDTYKVIDVYLI